MPAAIAQPHILFVEDDDSTRLLLGHLLEAEGYLVTAVADGEMALQVLKHNAFDVLVTDIELGRVSGIQVINTARSQERPPVAVVITGNTTLETAVEAFRAGAYDYLLKPCTTTDLLERVAHAVRHHAIEMVRLDAIRAIIQLAAQIQHETSMNTCAHGCG